jgi:predicted acetyltransferase
MSFELITVAESDRAVLENLTQLYLYDFAEHFAGTPFGGVCEDGRFPAFFQLDDYWRRPGAQPFLLRLDGRVAGFALVGGQARSQLRADACVDEFFVLRSHRRQGIGRRAAHALFERLSGQWEVAVMRRNTAAVAFWRAAVRTFHQAADARELDGRTGWDGPIFRFMSRPFADAPRAPDLGPLLRQGPPQPLDEQIRGALARAPGARS